MISQVTGKNAVIRDLMLKVVTSVVAHIIQVTQTLLLIKHLICFTMCESETQSKLIHLICSKGQIHN